jgi:hypothetical protein
VIVFRLLHACSARSGACNFIGITRDGELLSPYFSFQRRLLLLEPFLSRAVFLHVPCFVLHLIVQIPLDCGLQSWPLLQVQNFKPGRRLPSIPVRALDVSS